MVTSSGTRAPRSTYGATSAPSGEPSRTAARNRSPVEMWGSPSVAARTRGLGALAGARRADHDDDGHATALAVRPLVAARVADAPERGRAMAADAATAPVTG